ncbi:hypothetical protein HPB50_004528 [Hyalomma asiaticum]|uniref:Uncharacterized protein n=1 Tax=Hyalomma asiaticum TaxID=266040 RepID=A0ACB7S090_HYAAI|nr:hypothetical protein HPB50_004528 [Hyalomma asiaticum]
MEPLMDQHADSYLSYLRVPKCEPTLEYLDQLIRVHLERVAFENLDLLLNRRVSLDAEDVLSKITGRGRGGSCFELNSLFCRLLKSLGFSVSLRVTRRRLATPDDSGQRTRISHMVLLVELAYGERYIVDVGGVLCGLHRALPLVGDAAPFRVSGMDTTKSIDVLVPTADGSWKVMYVVEPYDLDWLDFRVIQWYSSTHPDSAVRRNLLVGRRSPRADGCWLRIVNERFVRWSPARGVVDRRVMRDENEILNVLRTEFGLNLSAADDVESMRVRLREVLENTKLGKNWLSNQLLWPEI